MLGTNGVEALPALLNAWATLMHKCEPTRLDAFKKLIAFPTENHGHALGENISHANQLPHRSRSRPSANLQAAPNSAFVTLIGNCGDWRARPQQSKYYLINISRDDPKFMLECLDDSDAKVRLGALIVFYDLVRGVPEAIPKLRELATNDPDANVRSRAADVLQLQLQ